MRGPALAVMVLLFGCDAGKKQEKPVPPGPYVVGFDCSHSMEPWGRGGSIRNQKFDLGAKSSELLDYEYGDPMATPEPPKLPPPVVTPLTPERVAAIETAVKTVLRGGPYKEEIPVSEGTQCTLSIRNQSGELLKLEKAYTKEPDAASALVILLQGPVQ